jgi:uncharacterized membrane protein HdeD (DUF308 family)
MASTPDATTAARDTQALADAFVRHMGEAWGWVLFRGLAAIAFGAMAILWPGITLVVLALFWGAWAFVDGIGSIAAAWKARDDGTPVWPLWLMGIAGIGAGVVTALVPGLTAFALLMLIAAWAIVTGVFTIVHALRVRKTIDNEWALVLSGVLSVLFGVAMVFAPGAGALAVIWLIAGWSILIGVLLASAALRFRAHRARTSPAA